MHLLRAQKSVGDQLAGGDVGTAQKRAALRAINADLGCIGRQHSAAQTGESAASFGESVASFSEAAVMLVANLDTHMPW